MSGQGFLAHLFDREHGGVKLVHEHLVGLQIDKTW